MKTKKVRYIFNVNVVLQGEVIAERGCPDLTDKILAVVDYDLGRLRDLDVLETEVLGIDEELPCEDEC